MSSRRQDKLVEEIRAIRKLKPNKRCFDCTEKGPTYVCTNFSTFICTTCAGIHREFSHVVKSISMATFTPEEVEKIKEGGNGPAKKYWRSRWTEKSFPMPDNNDAPRVREFMKDTYELKRWVKKAKKKKKKKKKQYDSDEDEDSEEESSEEEVEQKRRRKKKGKAKKGRRKSDASEPTPRAKPTSATSAPAPTPNPPSNGNGAVSAIANLFGDVRLSQGNQPAQQQMQPQPVQQRSQDSWANEGDWADFGTAKPQPPQQQPSVRHQPQAQLMQQQQQRPQTRMTGFSQPAPSNIMPEFDIMSSQPASPQEPQNVDSKNKPKSPLAVHQAMDDPFAEILGGGDDDDPKDSSVHLDTNANPISTQGSDANMGNPFVTGPPQPQQSQISTMQSPSMGNRSVPHSPMGMNTMGGQMQGMGMGRGIYPQMNQQQMLLMQQQQQYMMMLQQRQAMMMQMQNQQNGMMNGGMPNNNAFFAGQGQGGQVFNGGQQQGGGGGFGEIDIGNPFAQ